MKLLNFIEANAQAITKANDNNEACCVCRVTGTQVFMSMRFASFQENMQSGIHAHVFVKLVMPESWNLYVPIGLTK